MVPGTQIGSMTAAEGIAADVIVIDLYETVASQDKPEARLNAAEWLRVSVDTISRRLVPLSRHDTEPPKGRIRFTYLDRNPRLVRADVIALLPQI
mgnify:CR=1 FL=1